MGARISLGQRGRTSNRPTADVTAPPATMIDVDASIFKPTGGRTRPNATADRSHRSPDRTIRRRDAMSRRPLHSVR